MKDLRGDMLVMLLLDIRGVLDGYLEGTAGSLQQLKNQACVHCRNVDSVNAILRKQLEETTKAAHSDGVRADSRIIKADVTITELKEEVKRLRDRNGFLEQRHSEERPTDGNLILLQELTLVDPPGMQIVMPMPITDNSNARRVLVLQLYARRP